jgi:methylated-DNA-[protein]-cysteine S-methyltransferase
VTRRVVTYDAGAWGVGELVFDGDMPLHHAEPSWRRADGESPLPGVQTDLVERLAAYYRGREVSFADLDLDPILAWAGATPFEAAAVRALVHVPYAQTVSYAELARMAGRPGAHRAAGSVCARGTLSILVPYHRVIRSDGTLGPYGPDGSDLKRRLLALEGVELGDPA